MAADLNKLTDYIWCEEGGATYTNKSDDTGGPTKYGVTLKVYRAYTGNYGLTANDVKNLDAATAKKILAQKYWYYYNLDKIKDEWIAYYLCDWLYLSFHHEYLEKCLNINKNTGFPTSMYCITAINNTIDKIGASTLFKNLTLSRLAQHQSLASWRKNSGGYTRRILYDMVYGGFAKKGCSVSTVNNDWENTANLWTPMVSTGIQLTGTALGTSTIDSSIDVSVPPRIYQEFASTITVDELSVRIQKADGNYSSMDLNMNMLTTKNDSSTGNTSTNTSTKSETAKTNTENKNG